MNANSFVEKIRTLLDEQKLNKRTVEIIANEHGIFDLTLIKELTELAIVLKAREIALSSLNRRERFTKIVEIYKNQVNLSHRTSQSIILQQYSTPAPISFLAGEYVKHSLPKNYKLLEPSAGNGLLTISFNPNHVIVNEVDEIRYSNLKKQDYNKIYRFDASECYADKFNFRKQFDGIITNPPFGRLENQYIIDDYKISTLDHAMAIHALNCMKDNGRAAIIIGGHTDYDSKGRIKAGKNRIFFHYLYTHYNVDDVINIDGSLYSRQGTSFDVRLILINGRKIEENAQLPLKDESALPVKDFETLYNRVVKNLIEDDEFETALELANELLIMQKQSEFYQLIIK